MKAGRFFFLHLTQIPFRDRPNYISTITPCFFPLCCLRRPADTPASTHFEYWWQVLRTSIAPDCFAPSLEIERHASEAHFKQGSLRSCVFTRPQSSKPCFQITTIAAVLVIVRCTLYNNSILYRQQLRHFPFLTVGRQNAGYVAHGCTNSPLPRG